MALDYEKVRKDFDEITSTEGFWDDFCGYVIKLSKKPIRNRRRRRKLIKIKYQNYTAITQLPYYIKTK